MVRTQIQLTEEQANVLRRLAAAERVSLSELVRRGVARVIEDVHASHPIQQTRRQCALAAVGRFSSGQSDGSEQHDAIVAQSFGA